MTCRAPCEPMYPTSMAEFQPSSRWIVKFHLWTIGLRKLGSTVRKLMLAGSANTFVGQPCVKVVKNGLSVH